MADLRPLPNPAQVKKAEATVSALLAGRVFVPVTVPRTDVKGAMRLVSRSEVSQIRADARKALEATGYRLDAGNLAGLGVIEEWNSEFAVRHLAVAVRNADDNSQPLATLEEWRACDDDQIAALWVRYQDMSAEFDPLGGDHSTADFSAIELAAKKKDVAVLMSYGSRRLADFAITSAGQQSS